MAVAGAFLASKARYNGDQLSGKSPRRRSANATRTAAGTAGSTLGYEIGKAFAGEMGGRIGRGVIGSFSRNRADNLSPRSRQARSQVALRRTGPRPFRSLTFPAGCQVLRVHPPC